MGCRNLILAATGLMFTGVLATGTESPRGIEGMAILSPTDGATMQNFLTAVLSWEYPLDKNLVPWSDVSLEVSRQADLSQPFIQCDLHDEVTEYRFAALPTTTYYWRITPFAIKDGDRVALVKAAAQGRFTTGKPLNRVGATDTEHYRNPPGSARWVNMPVVPYADEEPLSPWFEIKSYRKSPPPTLDQIRDHFPVPVWDGHQDALDAYWYCWNTMLACGPMRRRPISIRPSPI